jgi:hypothetical protein
MLPLTLWTNQGVYITWILLYFGVLSQYSDRIWAGRSGFNCWWGREIFSTPPCPDRLWGPSSLLSNGYGGSFPPSSPEVKHGEALPPLHHTSSWCDAWLIEHGDSFALPFTFLLFHLELEWSPVEEHSELVQVDRVVCGSVHTNMHNNSERFPFGNQRKKWLIFFQFDVSTDCELVYPSN